MVDEQKAMALAKRHVEIYLTECKTLDLEEARNAADILGFMVHNLIVALDDPNTIIIRGAIKQPTTH